jgi:hypothetical protein
MPCINIVMANFTNLNQCFQTTQTLAGLSAKPLSSYSCSEVYIYNHTANDLFIFTEGMINLWTKSITLSSQTMFAAGLYYRLQTLNGVTIRGITNTSQVSAFLAGGGNGQVSYIAQFFSDFPLTVY